MTLPEGGIKSYAIVRHSFFLQITYFDELCLCNTAFS